MKTTFMKPIVMMLAGALLFSSCSKENDDNNDPNTGTAQVNFHLTDDPAVYDHVYLNIQKVEVTMEGHSAVTLTPIRPGIYDILMFRNGLDTLLMRATLPAEKVSQIRLILGNNNSVVENGNVHALTTPSAQESGLKLNLHESFVAGGAYDVWIDFDAGKSIVVTGGGTYKLKPVIRAYSQTTNGQIKGYVLPLYSQSIVYAINGADTLAAIPAETDGFFWIKGMPEGTYQVVISPGILSLQAYTIANVQISYGMEVNLGTITLLP
jgi:hypothetical protein